jgi:hypothetical protein
MPALHTYRISRKIGDTYRRTPTDVSIHTPNVETAALKYAKEHYRGPERVLDLMVASFGHSSIETLQRVIVTKPDPDWYVVSEEDHDEWD